MKRSEHKFGNVIKIRQSSGKMFVYRDQEGDIRQRIWRSSPLPDLDFTRSGSLEVKAERPKQRVKAEEQDKTVVVISSDISTPQTSSVELAWQSY